jgi:hypothetical protein
MNQFYQSGYSQRILCGFLFLDSTILFIVQSLHSYEYDEDNVLFDRITNCYESCGDLIWLSNEDHPECIVYSEYEEQYFHIDDCTYAYVDGQRQDFIHNENCYYYDAEYYLYDALCEHDLAYYDGRVYHTDDMAYCEDTEENVPIDQAYYNEDDNCYYSNYNRANKKGLKGYHQSEIKDKSNNAKIKIGFEIEKEDSNYTNFSNIRALNWDAEKMRQHMSHKQ